VVETEIAIFFTSNQRQVAVNVNRGTAIHWYELCPHVRVAALITAAKELADILPFVNINDWPHDSKHE
jgi:hypothetical protein